MPRERKVVLTIGSRVTIDYDKSPYLCLCEPEYKLIEGTIVEIFDTKTAVVVEIDRKYLTFKVSTNTWAFPIRTIVTKYHRITK